MIKKSKVKKIKKVKKLSKTKKKVSLKKSVNQNNYKPNIFKSNEVKVKIKKILKQPLEKKLYNLKDYVVYPKHGVGKIMAVEKLKLVKLI